jgi:xylitol oxidase
MTGSNWGGNYAYRARRLHRPRTLDELRALVAEAGRIRVLGSRHSFTDIADSEELVSLDELPSDVRVDPSSLTVSCSGATRYVELAEALGAAGLALGNLASLPHLGVAGAVATATHGSGDHNGNLATAVAAVELVTSDGELRQFRRGDPDFDGVVVGLGALGAVTRLEIGVEPHYLVRQRVFERMRWDVALSHLDDITSAGYSVSLFTRDFAGVDQVWVKRRDDEPPFPDDLFGAAAAPGPRHPIAGMNPVNCTPQLGEPGPWSDRLPHFRAGFTPSAGDEIQSEYSVPRGRAADAIRALLPLARIVGPVLRVSELRTVAADTLWMSPHYCRDSLGIHFTWRRDQPAVERAAAAVEDALAPFEPRPHWGKVFLARPPRLQLQDDFVALANRLDPRGAFRNAWFERHIL